MLYVSYPPAYTFHSHTWFEIVSWTLHLVMQPKKKEEIPHPHLISSAEFILYAQNNPKAQLLVWGTLPGVHLLNHVSSQISPELEYLINTLRWHKNCLEYCSLYITGQYATPASSKCSDLPGCLCPCQEVHGRVSWSSDWTLRQFPWRWRGKLTQSGYNIWLGTDDPVGVIDSSVLSSIVDIL